MDILGLITLREEMLADCAVLDNAAAECASHLTENARSRLQAAAFEIARFYNVVEQMALRVARDFENNIPPGGGWHDQLLKRMVIPVPSVRPSLFTEDLKRDLDELRRFRHLVHHAYDIQLREDRILELAGITRSAAVTLRELCGRFVAQVASQNGWELPLG